MRNLRRVRRARMRRANVSLSKEIRHESGRILRLRFWALGWWGELFCPTDMGGCWVWAQIRPKWYWWIHRAALFLFLAWRRYEEQYPQRISIATAWQVSEVARGLSLWRVTGEARAPR